MQAAKIIALLAALIILFTLTSCHGQIGNEVTKPTYDSEALIPDNIVDPPAPAEPDVPRNAGEFYGSYLTMYIGHTPPEHRGVPYIKILHTYSEVEDYYDSALDTFLFGARFTIAMASFTDDFLADKDVLVAVIDEPSSYVNHSAEPIEITESEVNLNIRRHVPENYPLQSTLYHLIFTAPKGSFDGIDEKKLSLNIDEVVDSANNSAFDAERFRIYYPEYVTFCYRTDAITSNPAVAVEAISSYEGLTTYFLDKYSSDYDFNFEFNSYVGTLYNWEVFERYFIIAAIIPVADVNAEPNASDLFVNNLEIYLTLDAELPAEGKKPAACYLLLTAIEKSELVGVDLSRVNVAWE